MLDFMRNPGLFNGRRSYNRPPGLPRLLFHLYAGEPGLTSHFYARFNTSTAAQQQEAAVLDLVYIALGLSLFGLMQLYARWAAKG
jgi:hypothetical protein